MLQQQIQKGFCVARCDVCNEQFWISPSVLQGLRVKSKKVLCRNCHTFPLDYPWCRRLDEQEVRDFSGSFTTRVPEQAPATLLKKPVETSMSDKEVIAILQAHVRRGYGSRWKVGEDPNCYSAFAKAAGVAMKPVVRIVKGESRQRKMGCSFKAKLVAEIHKRGWDKKPEGVTHEPEKGAQEALKELPERPTLALTDREKALLTYCIFHGQIPFEAKESLIRKLLPDAFPSL